MTEELLHFTWKHGLFNSPELHTTDGLPLTAIKRGQHNHDAGPDFLQAKIKIGNTTWAGQVEIHQKSSDWYAHKHSSNPAYHNVILHVVYEHDKEVLDPNGRPLPCLELKQYIAQDLLLRYEQLQLSKQSIPCASQIEKVPKITISMAKERMLVERLEQKTNLIAEYLAAKQNNWDAVALTMIARYIGTKVNRDAFTELIQSIPPMLIPKYAAKPDSLAALLFGQAGFLNGEIKDDYPAHLEREYKHLQRLHQLQAMPTHRWKFMRMRPANFPTIRIAQLAALLHKYPRLFSVLLECRTLKDFSSMFEVELPAYWQNHYRFGEESVKRTKSIGSSLKNILLINAVAPLLFIYGQQQAQPALQDKAIDLLGQLAAEENTIVRSWEKLGIKASTAADSQALIQLKTVHCNNLKCLKCVIGTHILQK